ncbi:MAG: pyridoxamine 5'-phosphate oxidase family protein [Lachnospiraceae bacterium]|nr:pyridoxamine 5'-phosphate oxidase family protein [Lachnospiraceae bacterium]
MRRHDREITDPTRINEIISACTCCRLGLNDDGKVYIVPLNFGYEENQQKKIFYFHGAVQGRKLELIQKTHYAGFELDTNYELHTAGTACAHSARFQSIIGTGKIDIIEYLQEKRRALGLIMYHNTQKADWDFPEKALQAVAVFKLEVDELTCKEHL